MLQKHWGQRDLAAWDWFKAKVTRRTFSSLQERQNLRKQQ